jgi:hypothetical protein
MKQNDQELKKMKQFLNQTFLYEEYKQWKKEQKKKD